MPTRSVPRKPVPRPLPGVRQLARAAGLRLVEPGDLTLQRRRSGKGFTYLDAKGRAIRDKAVRQRLASLAVPPAYADVRYAMDERAHLQAVGTDAAGRLQYRYHADWEKVREKRKAARLAAFAQALPRIQRSIGRDLALDDLSRRYALAAVVELVSLTVLRAGGEAYAKERGTRGAATLLKSNVNVEANKVVLRFKAKGGVRIVREVSVKRLARVVKRLLTLPGRRLFQWIEDGQVHEIRATDVNDYLREAAAATVSLKDFRTLVASAQVLEALAKHEPGASVAARRRQILGAVREAAEELGNTPTVCRKSYVHETVVTAFEAGALAQYAERLGVRSSRSRRAEVLADVMGG